jgi:DNA (cytosine-5)-methyltransferase 1
MSVLERSPGASSRKLYQKPVAKIDPLASLRASPGNRPGVEDFKVSCARASPGTASSVDYGQVTPTLLEHHGRTKESELGDCPASNDGVKAGIVDLCAGIGCVARGFEATNDFEAVALVDIDIDARRTWEQNYSHVDYLAADVRQLKAGELLQCADGREIMGIVGCPPCQGFSAAGRRRADDDRNKLLKAFFDVVQALSPQFFVMENVPSILHRSELRAQEEALDQSYEIRAGLINAALFGLPQTRERAVVIGIQRELDITPSLPTPTHLGTRRIFGYGAADFLVPTVENLTKAVGASPQIGISTSQRHDVAESLPDNPDQLQDLVTVWDAIGDLPALTENRATPPSPPSKFALSLGAKSEMPDNHERWGHSDTTVKRLSTIPEGRRLKTERRYYSQAYARLHRQGLSRTITTNFHNAGCGRFTHPLEPRTITVREAARLQGISDDFRFSGHGALQERLVGNAFPPILAEVIAQHLAAQLRDAGALP